MMIPPSSLYLSGNIQSRNPKDKLVSEEKRLDSELEWGCIAQLNSVRSNTLLKVNV